MTNPFAKIQLMLHSRPTSTFLTISSLCVTLIFAIGGGVQSSRAQAPTTEHGDPVRSIEALTSGTLLLERAAKVPRKEGDIDFDLLRATKLYRKPPPVYPEELSALDGKPIRIMGFMAPYESLTDMSTFMLMPMATGCFFCQPPSPKEVVLVRQAVKEGETAKYISEPIEVTGTFSLWKKDHPDPAHQMFLFVADKAVVKALEEDATQ